MESNQDVVSVQPSWTELPQVSNQVGQDGKRRPTSMQDVQLQRDLIKQAIITNPRESDRSIAKQIDCSPSTVSAVRKGVSNLSNLNQREVGQEVGRIDHSGNDSSTVAFNDSLAKTGERETMSVDMIVSQIDQLTANAAQITDDDRKRISEAFAKFKTATAVPYGQQDSPEFHWISTRLEHALEPILAEIRAVCPVTDEDMIDVMSLIGCRDMLIDAVSVATKKAAAGM